MAISVSLGLEDAAAVVRHRADAPHREHLRATGERLRTAAHPGVVVVLRSQPLGDGWELVTAHAGHALTSARVGAAPRLATVAAGAAATVADLHERGVVHGRLRPEHVLLGPEGVVVLCGFGPAPGDAEPGDDVAALGAVVEGVAAGLEQAGRANADQLRPLRAVARAARSHPPTRRPSARRLSAELAALGEAGRTGPRAGPRRSLATAAGAGVAVALVVVASTASGGGPAPDAGAGTSTSAAPVRAARCVAWTGLPLDAADCGHDVEVEVGAVVVDGERSAVGVAGDVVAVADWGCAGAPRPAVLRPSTGEVLVFSGPGAGGARHVEAAQRVPGARALTAVDDATACPQIVVELADGVTVTLERAGSDA